MVPERIGKVKIVLIGDERVGKTTLRKQYMGQKQTVTYMATIGADFAKRDTKITLTVDGIHKDYLVESLIWDLAGQEAYKMVRESFYEGASGALVVLDISRPETFDTAQKWFEELWANNGKKDEIPFIILINKSDLKDNENMSIIKDKIAKIKEFVTLNTSLQDISIFETSALTGGNVEEAFSSLIINIMKEHTT